MLSAKQVLDIIECKSSNDGHVVEDPITLPCGYGFCKSCYKTSKYCYKCEKDHIINPDQIQTNNLVLSVLRDSITEMHITCSFSLNEHISSVRCLLELKNGEVISGSLDKTIKVSISSNTK